MSSEHKPEFNAQLVKLLSRFLSRPDDRALFGLLPLPPEKPELVQKDVAASQPSAAPTTAIPDAPAERMTG